MFKIILFAVLFTAVVYWLKRIVMGGSQRKGDRFEDEMFECDLCGVYVSEREALKSHGKYFCSQECLRKGA